MERRRFRSPPTPGDETPTRHVGGRGRRRNVRQRPARLTAADARRQVDERTQQQRENIMAMIGNVELDELRELVFQLQERQPALFFEIWERQNQQGNQNPPQAPERPEWCTCGRCRHMPTAEERVCCLGSYENCLSLQPEIHTVVLDPLVLGVARAYRHDILGDGDNTPNEPSKANRHAAYRQFVLCQYGRLGNRNRRVIPSCVVWKIRDTFPDLYGNYVGYIPSRLI